MHSIQLTNVWFLLLRIFQYAEAFWSCHLPFPTLDNETKRRFRIELQLALDAQKRLILFIKSPPMILTNGFYTWFLSMMFTQRFRTMNFLQFCHQIWTLNTHKFLTYCTCKHIIFLTTASCLTFSFTNFTARYIKCWFSNDDLYITINYSAYYLTVLR